MVDGSVGEVGGGAVDGSVGEGRGGAVNGYVGECSCGDFCGGVCGIAGTTSPLLSVRELMTHQKLKA